MEFIKETGVEPREQEMVDSWEPRITSNPTITFVFNDTEVSRIMHLHVKQSLVIIFRRFQLGLVDDVDAYLAEMNAKLDGAGIKIVEEELFKQYNEWLAAR